MFFISIVTACASLLLSGCGPKATAENKREYAGSSSCKECHLKFYKLWAPSHHGKALQPWSAELAAQLPPNLEPIEVEGNIYQAFVSPERGWVTEITDNATNEYDIIYTLGGKNYYNMMTLLPDGRIQVLPVFYNVRDGMWDNTTMSMLRHFEDGRVDTAVSWRDSMLTFNAACFSCHVSQINSNYDPETDTYDTTWAEPGISCESCHGPCSEHVRIFQETPEGTMPKEMGLIGWWDMDLEERNSACAGCHTKGAPVSDGYETGDRYWDHYDLTTFEDNDYYADGRDFGENYTMGSWLLSPCVTKGDLACTHCHTSSGRNKQKDEPNNACLPCHQARVENPLPHTHHPKEAGINCVDCHMPMNPFGGMNQSDHSMRPPMPQLSEAVGSRNACIMCHADQDNAWALKNINTWHPDFEEHRAFEMERALLVKSMTDGDWEKLPAVLDYIENPESEPLFIATLIRQLPQRNDVRQKTILRKLVTDAEHPLVRSVACTSLDADRDPADHPSLLRALSDDYRLVRIRAAERLIALPDGATIPTEFKAAFDAASKEMWISYNLRQDHWSSHFNAGNILMRQDRIEEAAAKYDRAHELRDDIPQPLINASMSYAHMGKQKEAEERLIKATHLPEPSGEAHFNLGLLYAEQSRLDEAEAELYKAIEITPENAQAACNLAIIKAGKDYPECFRLLKQAIAADPYNSRYVETLAYYYMQTGQQQLAANELELAMGRGINNQSIQQLYQQLMMPPASR